MKKKLNTLRKFMMSSYDNSRNSLEINSAMDIKDDIKYLDKIIEELANEEQQPEPPHCHIADISGCFCDHEFLPVKSIVEKCHKCGEIKITIGAK